MVLLDFDAERLAAVLSAPTPDDGSALAAALEAKIGSLRWALGRAVSASATAEALAKAFAETCGVRLSVGQLTERESEEAERLVEAKYANSEWTFRR
jgi:lipoate-protein ligase A